MVRRQLCRHVAIAVITGREIHMRKQSLALSEGTDAKVLSGTDPAAAYALNTVKPREIRC